MIDYKLLSQKREEIKQEVLDKLKITNRLGVVQYTGFGKSYLMTNLCKELDGRKLIIEPTNVLKFNIESRLDKSCNTDVVLYRFVSSKSHLVLDTIFSNIEYLFIDECHRTFSKKFKINLDYIVKKYPDIKIVGFTATSERTDGIDVINEFFKEKVSELTLIDALENNFVDDITYIAAYADPKLALKKTNLGNLKRIQLENVYKIPEILKRRIDRKEYLDNKNFKILLFVGRLNYIDNMSKNVIKWFNEAFPDKKVNTHLLKTEVEKDEANEMLKEFENNNNINEIDILISVNRLSEGLHINNVRCSMFFRKTVSRIIFNQQLGRITHSEKPIAFDFVENFHNIRNIINNLDDIKAFKKGEYEKKTTREKEYKENVITNKIIIIDESKEIRDIVNPYSKPEKLSNEDKQWLIENSINFSTKQLIDLFKNKYERYTILNFIHYNNLKTISRYEESQKDIKLLKDNIKEIENMTVDEINKKFFSNKYNHKTLNNLLLRHNIFHVGTKRITEEQEKFIRDNINNLTLKDISKRIHKTTGTISQYLKDNNLKTKYMIHTEKKLKIKNIVRDNITLTALEIKNLILKEIGIEISDQTICRYRKEIRLEIN